MTTLLGASRGGAVSNWGVLLVIASILLPALPFGPLFAQPPIPIAAFWAAYGWASEDQPGWRAPLFLALFGLLHDLMAGGPIGLFPALYLGAFLVGRVLASLTSAPDLLPMWGGFIATCIAVVALAALLTRIAMGHVAVRPFAEAAVITALLFPLVRPLFMSESSVGGR